MPKQVTKSAMLAQLGDKGRKAFDEHKADETNFGFGGDLPAGIEFGKAQLVECKFDTYKKGELQGKFYFYAAGTVIEPREIEVNGAMVKVEGLRTSITEPMCDTPKKSRQSVEEHVAWVLNEMRKLGIKTEEISFDDLETTAAALKEAAPFFGFRTWKGEKATEGPFAGKEPLTNHQWKGHIEHVETDPDAGVVDNTSNAELGVDSGESGADTSTTAVGSDGELDLDALLAVAEDPDEVVSEPARIALAKIASEAGVSEEDVQNAANWTEVIALIRNAGPAADDGPVVDDGPAVEAFKPKKGQVHLYPILDPKTKKKVNTEVEVMAVQDKAETVHGKNLNTGKPILGRDGKPYPIKWADFVQG